jgi:hypothetical protein
MEGKRSLKRAKSFNSLPVVAIADDEGVQDEV